MLARLIFAVSALLWCSNAELIMEVYPEFVNPGVTQSFSINCAVVELEEASIIDISISREVAPGISESMASIGGFSANFPNVSAAYPQVTAVGQISAFETEMGSYLKVVYPAPTVEELGTYQCDVVLVHAGAVMPMTVQAIVTTSDPMIDNILKKIHALEQTVVGINDTVTGMQNQLYNVTASETEAASEFPSTNTTTGLPQTTTARQTAETTPSAPAGSLNPEMEQFMETVVASIAELNGTLTKIQQRLDEIEVEEQEQNETETEIEPEEAGVDQILEYFTAGNSSYFLIQAGQPSDSYRAEADCNRRGLGLAEINDKEEFTAVGLAIAPFVEPETQVMVSGIRKPGQAGWVFPASGEKVSFLQWAAGQPVESGFADCIVVSAPSGVAEMTSIPCSVDQPSMSFICESL